MSQSNDPRDAAGTSGVALFVLAQDGDAKVRGSARVVVPGTGISAVGVTPIEARTIAAYLVALMLGVSPIGLKFRLAGWPERVSDVAGFWTCTTPTWGWDLRHPVERAAWLMRYRYEQSDSPPPDGPLLAVIDNDGRMHESAPGLGIALVGDSGRSFGLARSLAEVLQSSTFATSIPDWSGVWPPMVLTQPDLAAHLGDSESVREAVASMRFGSSAQAAGFLKQMEVVTCTTTHQ